MSSEKRLRLPKSLAFRLTIWYSLVFTISSLVAIFGFHQFIQSTLQERTDKELLTEAAELTSYLTLRGFAAVLHDIREDAGLTGLEQMFVRVLTPDGAEIASSDLAVWQQVRVNRAALKRLISGDSHVFETRDLTSSPHKMRVLYGIIGPDRIVQLGKILVEKERLINIFKESILLLFCALIVAGILLGWFMARRALSGIEEVSKAAEEIARGSLHRRVSTRSHSAEIDRLAATFNHMVDRIHSLLHGMREMTDNITHDLKGPITRIRGIAELTLTSSDWVGACESMAANTIEECDRLLTMVDTMLTISEIEAGAGRAPLQDVNLAEVLVDACDLFEPVAEDKGVILTMKASAGKTICGNLQQLQRMVANLLDNAVKHTPESGTVTASIQASDHSLAVVVADTGIGIAPHEVAKIFDRFYRCDRSRSEQGFGLGLSLVRAIARFHNGDVSVASSPGKGSTFVVTFPCGNPPVHNSRRAT